MAHKRRVIGITPKEVRYIRGAMLRLAIIIETGGDKEFLEQSRDHFDGVMTLTDRLLEDGLLDN